VDDKTRVCTYLLGGLENKDIEPPLGHFQHTKPEKEDTRQLLHTINKAVGGDDPLPEKTLDAVFDQFWPELKKNSTHSQLPQKLLPNDPSKTWWRRFWSSLAPRQIAAPDF